MTDRVSAPMPKIATILDRPGRLRIAVRVQPRASRTRVVGSIGDALKVQVTAPPVEGAANAALIALLAEVLEVPRLRIRVVAGDHSRSKIVEIETEDPAALEARLQELLAR